MRNLSGQLYWWVRDRITRTPFVFRYIKLRPELGRFDTCTTWEIEYPYRQGTAFIFRVIGMHGFQFGILDSHPSLDDDQIDYRLIQAIQSVNGGTAYCKEAWEDEARRTVAAFALDAQDAAQLSEMIGLDDGLTEVVSVETSGN